MPVATAIRNKSLSLAVPERAGPGSAFTEGGGSRLSRVCSLSVKTGVELKVQLEKDMMPQTVVYLSQSGSATKEPGQWGLPQLATQTYTPFHPDPT